MTEDGESAGAASLRRQLMAPARVRELSRRRPRRVARDAAACWVLIIMAWVVAARIDRWWALALAAVVVGNRFYALYIIGHDGLHRRLLDGTRANDLLCDALVMAPIGGITRINNRNHLMHHQFLATDTDPDRHKHGCANKATLPGLLGYLTSATSVVRSVTHVFVGNSDRISDRTRAQGDGDARRSSYRLRDISLIVAWQLGLIALLTWMFGWWGYLAMWWAPVFALAFLADNLRAFVEHSHPEPDRAADRHRLITHRPGWFERQLLSPMNMNFHAAHHLWPSIPYYNLPAADAELRHAADEAGLSSLSWRRSYIAYVWRYARSLPLEGCRPEPAHA